MVAPSPTLAAQEWGTGFSPREHEIDNPSGCAPSFADGEGWGTDETRDRHVVAPPPTLAAQEWGTGFSPREHEIDNPSREL